MKNTCILELTAMIFNLGNGSMSIFLPFRSPSLVSLLTMKHFLKVDNEVVAFPPIQRLDLVLVEPMLH
jgi:hypothetical protein